MATPFVKLHGLGNDFIVVDGLKHRLPASLHDSVRVQQLCDRHRGIGGDGILFILPPQTPTAYAHMVVRNADGSVAEMCGNGIRCVAKYLYDYHDNLRGQQSIPIDTGAGLLACGLTIGPDHKVNSVRVAMGPARLARKDIPMRDNGHAGEQFVASKIEAAGRSFISTAVSMGNPHLITFIESATDLRQLAETVGPAIEHHPDFPNRTNVEFAHCSSDGITLWVWERGCGITQACGTGACATAVAAVVTKRKNPNTKIPVRLPGGTLVIEVAADLSQVWMDGPAEQVFVGEFHLAE